MLLQLKPPSPRSRGPWQSQYFRRYFWTQATSQLGNGITQFAVILVLTRIAEAGQLPWLLAINLALSYLPYLVLGPAVGAIADRFPRHGILIFGDSMRALVTGLLLLALAHGALIAIFVLVLVHSTLGAIYEAARFAVLPSIVSPGDLRVANGYMQISFSLGQLAGPAIVGALFLYGAGLWVLLFDIVAFFASAIAIATLDSASLDSRTPRKGTSLKLEIREFGSILRTPLLAWTFGGVAILNLFTGSLSSYLPSLLASRGLGGATAGFVMAGGIFGLILSLLFRSLSFEWRYAPIAGLALRALSCLALAALPNGTHALVIAILLWAVSSTGTTMFQAGVTSIRQLAARPDQLGRVGSLARTIGWSTLPLSGFVAALVVNSLGLNALFIVAGVVSASLTFFLRVALVSGERQTAPD